MTNILQIILMAGVLKYSCKATFFKAYKGILVYTLLGGVITMLAYPFIIKINTNIISQIFNNKSLVADIAVLITIEAVIGMLISIGMLNGINGKISKIQKKLKYIPGLLIFGFIFFIEISLFRTMPGIPFVKIALLSAGLIMLGIFLISFFIKYFLKDITLRYELKFITNLLLLILAILLNAQASYFSVSNYNANTNYNKLVVFFAIFAVGFILGIIEYKYKKRLTNYFKK